MTWDPRKILLLWVSKFHDVFLIFTEFVNFLKKYGLKLLGLKASESEKITNLSERVKLSIKSKAKSIAFASAVKTEVPSGIRIESL